MERQDQPANIYTEVDIVIPDPTPDMLDTKQRYIYDYVSSSIDNNEQICLCVFGYGGSGKSYLLKQIRYLYHSHRKHCVVLGPTGVAANLVQGSTIHSYFRINQDTVNIRYDDIETDVFIIDEAFMVAQDVFQLIRKKMSSSCQFKHHFNEISKDCYTFPGLHPDCSTIYMGDPLQLSPVNSTFLWAQHDHDSDSSTLQMDDVLPSITPVTAQDSKGTSTEEQSTPSIQSQSPLVTYSSSVQESDTGDIAAYREQLQRRLQGTEDPVDEDRPLSPTVVIQSPQGAVSSPGDTPDVTRPTPMKRLFGFKRPRVEENLNSTMETSGRGVGQTPGISPIERDLATPSRKRVRTRNVSFAGSTRFEDHADHSRGVERQNDQPSLYDSEDSREHTIPIGNNMSLSRRGNVRKHGKLFRHLDGGPPIHDNDLNSSDPAVRERAFSNMTPKTGVGDMFTMVLMMSMMQQGAKGGASAVKSGSSTKELKLPHIDDIDTIPKEMQYGYRYLEYLDDISKGKFKRQS